MKDFPYANVNDQKGQSTLELAVSLPAYSVLTLCLAAILFNYYIRNQADYLLHEALVCQVSANDEGNKMDCQEKVTLQLKQLLGKPKVNLDWEISSDQAEAHLNLTYQFALSGGFEWHIKINRGVDLPLESSTGSDS